MEIEGQLGDVVVTHRKNEPEMVPQKYSKAFQIQCEGEDRPLELQILLGGKETELGILHLDRDKSRKDKIVIECVNSQVATAMRYLKDEKKEK